MTRVPALAGVLCLAGGVWAQAPSRSEGPAGTFPVTTRLVQVDVIVHDRDGRPVSGLTAADFELFEDHKPQPIETFSVHSDQPPPQAAAQHLPAGEFSNRLGGRAAGSVSVILVDQLNTTFADQAQAKRQVVKFLGQVRREDGVALYVLHGGGVRVLHDFTSDPASLLLALARQSGDTSRELSASEAEAPPETGNPEIDAWLGEVSQRIASSFMEDRVKATAEGLEAIAGHLGGVRGRKNLIWVSSGFPLVVDKLPRTDELRRATRAITNANIAVYPVDARGLIGAFATGPASLSPVRDAGKASRGALTTLGTVMTNVEPMQIIAEDTGGRASFNSNDISRAIRRAVDDGRLTYTMGYSPSHGKWDGGFHEIKVKVKRSGVEVRHRRGYLALPALPRQGGAKRQQELFDVVRSPLQSTGIGLRVRVERADDPDERNLAIGLDPGSVSLRRTAQGWEGSFDVSIVQSVADGGLVKSVDTTVDLRLSSEMRDKLLAEGMVLNKRVALRPDALRLHVVLRDLGTGSTGSLVIPADSVRSPAR